MLLCAWILATTSASVPAPFAGSTPLLDDAQQTASTTSTPAAAHPDAAKPRRLTFLLGGRSLDEGDWEPVDGQTAFEIDFEWRRPESAIGFEFGTAFAFDDATFQGIDIQTGTFEVFFGLRATADLVDGHLRPYVGAGPSLSFVNLELDDGNASADDEDTAFGFYVRGGVGWIFDGGFGIGVDYRLLTGTDVELFGSDGDVDFGQLGLTAGFAF